ncbi:MAG: hypothetical protein HYY14_00790 [Candidatus Omnitrophica bacterium]|nr:hypothetical protein [Candidatus Omnitrophota bacterium]
MKSCNNLRTKSQRVLSGLVWALFFCLFTQSVLAQEKELPPLTATLSTEQALAAIKERAKKIVEARKKAKRLKISGELSTVAAYETNPSNGATHKGDTYFEEDASVTLSKKLSNTWRWNASYSESYISYLEYTDGTYFTQTLTASKLTWNPGKMWRLEGWTDLDYNWYPRSNGSSYRQIKPVGRIRQNLTDIFFHQLQYEWFFRDYIDKSADDGEGTDTEDRRHDIRDRLRYKVGATIHDWLCTVENAWYSNQSNDQREDYYDYDVYKVTGSLNGDLTEKLSVSLSYAWERKNYEHRLVSNLDNARYDDKNSITLSATYTINDDWKVGGKVDINDLESNQPSGEYTDITNSLTVTRSF